MSNSITLARRDLTQLGKGLFWFFFRGLLLVFRFVRSRFGEIRTVDTIIYKADRLGDWLLAEPTILRIVAEVRSRGGVAVVWAARESAAFRSWRPPDYEVEQILLEPKGLIAKLKRAVSVTRLLAQYRSNRLICLRYSPEPVRDFILGGAAAAEVYAASWRIAESFLGTVPHEVFRHHALLTSVGIPPDDARDLLPAFPRSPGTKATRVVLAPFSSAPIKDWTDQGWCEVLSAIAGHKPEIELWVGPDQLLRAKRLAELIEIKGFLKRVTVVSGTLNQLAEAVSSAALVLTVDTFAAHLGAAFDAPMLCLIGGGQYGDFGPWARSGRQRWITHALPCFGCSWKCIRARVECLVDISPAKVVAEIESLLGP